MRVLLTESPHKHNLRKHERAKYYLPRVGSRYADMERFNRLLRVIDPEGDLFAVPMKGADIGLTSNREYITVWQMGLQEGTAEMRHALYDFKTMEPLYELNEERAMQIVGWYATCLSNADYEAMMARTEREWQKWRDDMKDATIKQNFAQLEETADHLYRQPVSRVVIAPTEKAEDAPPPAEDPVQPEEPAAPPVEDTPPPPPGKKQGRGRPKGSKNKAKAETEAEPTDEQLTP